MLPPPTLLMVLKMVWSTIMGDFDQSKVEARSKVFLSMGFLIVDIFELLLGLRSAETLNWTWFLVLKAWFIGRLFEPKEE